MSRDERVSELHSRAVTELVEAHRGRTDEPLVLAIRYRQDDPFDVHLLEVLSGFPGAGDDELLVTSFAPSAQLRILGHLHLALCSPEQLRSAISRGNPLIAEFAQGAVIYGDGTAKATELKKLLGL